MDPSVEFALAVSGAVSIFIIYFQLQTRKTWTGKRNRSEVMGLKSVLRTLREEYQKSTWHHLVIFVLTFLMYAALHTCRKAWSTIKDLFEKSLSPLNNTTYPYETWQREHMFADTHSGNLFLGQLDFLFLIAYGIGLFVSGVIGDRANLRYLITFGIVGSSILTFSFGFLSVPLHIENRMFFRCMFFFNGLLQSTGWPVLVAVMGNWFNKSSSGLVFGIWSSNANVGNVLGSLIVGAVVDYGYEYGMLLNTILTFCTGVIAFVCLIPHPREIGYVTSDQANLARSTTERNLTEGIEMEIVENPCYVDDSKPSQDYREPIKSDGSELFVRGRLETIDLGPPEPPNDTTPDSDAAVASASPEAISFLQAILIPGVIPYSLAYACLKMVNYSFFFWLPTYLTQGLGWHDSVSSRLSSFYDAGGIVGGIVAGVVSDFMPSRSPVVCVMLLLSVGSVYLYEAVGTHMWSNCLLMLVTGCLIGGPANTISTAITADLGKHEKIAGSKEALATVSGIIDGTGSLGAACGQLLVPVINKYGGWHWVFGYLIIMIFCSLAFVCPMLWNDYKAWKQEKGRIHADLTSPDL